MSDLSRFRRHLTRGRFPGGPQANRIVLTVRVVVVDAAGAGELPPAASL